MVNIAVALGWLLAPMAEPAAHEFWIAPRSAMLKAGDIVVGDLMVGIMLRGTPYPYLPEHIVRFDGIAGGVITAVTGLPGDIPALNFRPRGSGLQVFVHQTVPFRTTYTDWTQFQTYVADEGFPEIEAQHLGRGLPTTEFAERYTRYAKALVQVGAPKPGDRDQRTGMPFELVAEANPYDGHPQRLPVRLYWAERPASDVQISVLRDANGVRRHTLRTDADGRAVIDLQPGVYLLSAVRIDPVQNDTVVWSSHWAALSFTIER